MKTKTESQVPAEEVGREFLHKFHGLVVRVEVLGVKSSYGRRRWLVRPSGQPDAGQVWIYAVENPKFLNA